MEIAVIIYCVVAALFVVFGTVRAAPGTPIIVVLGLIILMVALWPVFVVIGLVQRS